MSGLGLAALLLSAAAAASSEQALLLRMNAALSELDYDGVSTYVQGDELSVLRLVHAVIDGVQHERLVHLNGAPREIIRTGDRVVCVMRPGDEILQLAGAIPAGPFVRTFTPDLQRIPEHYRLRAGRMDRIAGRAARELLIRPLDGDRYGHRLWIDDDTGLLLRAELLDTRRRQRLEVFQFTALKVGADVDPGATAPGGYDEVVSQELMLAETTVGDAPSGAPQLPWRLTWLPAGFRMAAHDERTKPDSLRKVSTLMYSDGIAAFSVFFERVDEGPVRERSTRRGGTVAVIRVLEGTAATLVTVVGEIPLQTAERIARSVRVGEAP